MKKQIITLNIGMEYAPEICELTYPYLKLYAHKIGAEFRIITESKYKSQDPTLPTISEKFQVYTMAQDPDTITYFIDSDALIFPSCPDWGALIDRGSVFSYGQDFGAERWKSNKYFARQQRWPGMCTWFIICDDICSELWEPPQDPKWAISQIIPSECESHIKSPASLLDDYQLSYNVAKYGLKLTRAEEIMKVVGKERKMYATHFYLEDVQDKIVHYKKGEIIITPSPIPYAPADIRLSEEDQDITVLGKITKLKRAMMQFGLLQLKN